MGLRAAFATIAAALVYLLATCQPGLAEPDAGFQPSATDAASALQNLPKRRQFVVTSVACGGEGLFFQAFLNSGKAEEVSDNPDQTDPTGEDYIEQILAKLVWLKDYANQTPASDGGSGVRVRDQPRVQPPGAIARDASLKNQPTSDGLVLNIPTATATCEGTLVAVVDSKGRTILPSWKEFVNSYGQACQGAISAVPSPPFTVTSAEHVSLSAACMKEQVNRALGRMTQGLKQLGSSKVPCHLTKATKGEWDVTVRDLVRIFYENAQIPEGGILSDDVRTYVYTQLLNDSGDVSPAGYSVLGCGNQTNDTGDAQDREDEADYQNSLGHDITRDTLDILKYLALVFAIFLAIAAAAPLLMVIPLGGVVGAGVVIGALSGAPLLPLIPESENHRLMIESSKYLTNQLLIDELQGAESDATALTNDQQHIKSFLLGKFNSVLTSDYIEYNSRPYSAYTEKALLNLYDFAKDPDIRLGAQALLNFTAAKFAIGSNQGRRLPPFRRHRHAVLAHIYEGDKSPPDSQEAFFYCCDDTDFQLPSMMYFIDQIQQLPQAAVIPPQGFLAAMLVNATSTFVPENVILDWAIKPDTDTFEQIHNAGVETYSRGAGYLITAGGTSSKAAYSSVAGIGGKEDDSGAGVETTLLLTNVVQSSTSDLIHFRGPVHATWEENTLDHNTCVWKTFACGASLFIPDNLEGCLANPGGAAAAGWFFIDTATCPAMKGASHLYIVLFRTACPPGLDCGFKSNFGFFELATPKAGENFQAFQKRMVDQNPRSGLIGSDRALTLGGTYYAASGDMILFDALANQTDSDDTGIEQVNGVDQPKISDIGTLAQGEFLSGGNGRITIGQGARAVTFDLSQADKPKRSPP